MLSTFLIALREGLEASLIVGILVAYLVRSGRQKALLAIWAGVAAAAVLALGFGALLSFTSANLSDRGEQLFAGTTSILAVGLVTWMVFWMKRSARAIAQELHGKVEHALGMGSFALALVAFLSVGREGLETSLFLYANFKTVNQDTAPLLGLIFGLAAAIALGTLIYKRSVKINISKFFRVTGVALIIVAGGVLIHGVNEFQSRGDIGGAHSTIWKFGGENSIFVTIIDGTFGISNVMTWLQFLVYILYVSLTLVGFLKALPATTPTPSKLATSSPASE
jgi:high-affinity iron transporter